MIAGDGRIGRRLRAQVCPPTCMLARAIPLPRQSKRRLGPPANFGSDRPLGLPAREFHHPMTVEVIGQFYIVAATDAKSIKALLTVHARRRARTWPAATADS